MHYCNNSLSSFRITRTYGFGTADPPIQPDSDMCSAQHNLHHFYTPVNTQLHMHGIHVMMYIFNMSMLLKSLYFLNIYSIHCKKVVCTFFTGFPHKKKNVFFKIQSKVEKDSKFTKNCGKMIF